MAKHLFLTGEKQVGKSTLLNRLLAYWDLPVAGLRTQPFEIQGQVKGHCLVSLLPAWPDSENHAPCVVRLDDRRCVGIPAAFDQNGAAMLESSRKSQAKLILMDELGRAEKSALLFAQEVALCLDGEIPVVGVLQKGRFPLKEAILARRDTRVVTVTAENREALFWELKNFHRPR